MQRTVEDFAKMRLDVGGMLDPKVYHELYLSARQSAHNILEIGTARGAATVALGLGALDGGHENVRVATVEKLGESYTERYGTPEDYRARLYGAFERYGVAERIDVHFGAARAIVSDPVIEAGLGLMFLDADGALDRDFSDFYGALVPGAAIIIDDYGTDRATLYINPTEIKIDQKHRLTKLLVHYFEEKGVLRKDQVVKETYFGARPDGATFEPNADEIFQVYRELTFSDAKLSSAAYVNSSRLLKKISPSFHLWLKTQLGK
ncbi:MAG: hypothetical protein OEN23_08550 [Paracoccaceae bacterium]|nr:hypothetical protein [Paracoccaceae bacterium]